MTPFLQKRFSIEMNVYEHVIISAFKVCVKWFLEF